MFSKCKWKIITENKYIFVLFFSVLNKKGNIFVYMYMLNKTNKCQINAKMYGKIFLIFFIFEQKK